MVGQGLEPGRTLSSSDGLLSSVPWQASKPADVPGLGTNFELADASNVFQPMLRYTRSQVPTVPLWNPYIMAGRPLLADGQSAVFSPFSVPSYILPFWKSLAVAAMLKLFLGALGAFILARVLGMRFGGALLTGVVFAFGTFFVVWLAWPLASVYAFIGWTLALTELLVRRPGRLPVAGLAAVVGLQFLGGHPESSFHLLFTASVFFVFRALWWRRRRAMAWRELTRPVAAYVLALAAGAGLAALVLAPFLEFVLHSGDLSHRLNAAAGFWPRKYLGALFLHDYWGRPTQVDLESFMQVRGWYAGAATLMLAATALLVRRSGERWAVAMYAAFCACMVVGIRPVFSIVSALPGFSAAHNERLLIYVLLSLALLAGWGLDDLTAMRLPRPSRRAVLAAAGTIFSSRSRGWWRRAPRPVASSGSGLKVAWGFVHPPTPPAGVDIEGTVTAAIVRDSALEIWLPLAAAGVALIALRLRTTRPLPTGVFVGLMVALIVVDLFRANMGFNPAIPIKTASPPVTGAIRYLQSQRPNRFIGVSLQQLSQPLPSDLAMTFGLYDARGYDFPVEKRFDDLWRRNVAARSGRLHPARGVRRRHARGPACTGPAQRLGPAHRPAPGDQVPAARAGAERGLPRDRRGGVPQRERAAAGVRGQPPAHRAQRESPAGRGHRPRLRRARGGDHRHARSGTAPGPRVGTRPGAHRRERATGLLQRPARGDPRDRDRAQSGRPHR